MNLTDSILKGLTDDEEGVKVSVASEESTLSVTMSSPDCIKHLPFILKSINNQRVKDAQLVAPDEASTQED